MCLCHIFFIHSSVGGHLAVSTFWLLWIVLHEHLCINFCLDTCLLFFEVHISRSGIAGSYGNSFNILYSLLLRPAFPKVWDSARGLPDNNTECQLFSVYLLVPLIKSQRISIWHQCGFQTSLPVNFPFKEYRAGLMLQTLGIQQYLA